MALIPPFNGSGLLPPYTGPRPSVRAGCSPYRVTLPDVAVRFGTSPERIAILEGFLMMRKDLRDLGITSGFQWLDGSFVEDIDKTRPPNDLDVVTFFRRPSQLDDDKDLDAAIQKAPNLFVPALAKKQYKCDAYQVDLKQDAAWIVAQARYWFGLFSHRRGDQQWKGMLEVDLGSVTEDDEAAKILKGKTTP